MIASPGRRGRCLIMSDSPSNKSLMRSIGEFFGHIVKGVKTDPSRKIIKKTVKEEKRNNVILRRTTIEEIELSRKPGPGKE